MSGSSEAIDGLAIRKCILAYSPCPSSSSSSSSSPPPTQAGTKVTFHFRTCLLHELPKSPSSPSSSWPHGEHDSLPAIDDSKQSDVAMELLLGKQFKMPIVEQFIKSMRVGEVAQFTVPKSLAAAYPFVSQAYRKYVTSVKKRQNCNLPSQVSGNEEDEHPGHRCCGMNLKSGTGHADLDELLQNPCDLMMVIHLVSVHSPDSYEKEIWQMDDQEKNTAIPRLKQQGNDLYKQGQYQAAADKYGKALAIIEQLQLKEKPGESEWIAFDTMKVPILSNFSQCKLHLKDYYEAIRHTSKVLELDPSNVKCFFRRAKAHTAVWNFDDARRDLAQVAALDAKMQQTVKRELATIDVLESEKRKEEASRFTGKLFSST